MQLASISHSPWFRDSDLRRVDLISPPKKNFKRENKNVFRCTTGSLGLLLAGDIRRHHTPTKPGYCRLWWDLHIPPVHLLIKAAHIQHCTVAILRLRLPWKFPRLDAFSESLTPEQWRAGRQFSRAGSTRKWGRASERERSVQYEFTAVSGISLHLSQPISHSVRLSPMHYFVYSTSNDLSKKSVSMWSVFIINTIIFSHSVARSLFGSSVRLIKFADCLRDMRIVSLCVLWKRDGLSIACV